MIVAPESCLATLHFRGYTLKA
ncbi:hypothetical protein HU200_015584 [Digitaria exilis]|uniref:Uncharacterized protein n=1 Tax=Digitaria exilis TaxID=1010633 RepID=A0A835F8M0_9POAL|nr:hypothetical protein HU200_015584 [Digitaria exilis]